jgi:hypothetical protein
MLIPYRRDSCALRKRFFRAGPHDGRASAGRSGYTPQGNLLLLSPYP